MTADEIVDALAPLRWGWLELSLEAIDRVPLEGFIGPTLRGLLGHALHDISCSADDRPAFGTGSAYHAVFEAPPSAPGEQDRPPPYILHAPPGPMRDLEAGMGLTFGLVLFGEATHYLPTILWALNRYGLVQGLSRERRRVLLTEAHLETPQGRIPVFHTSGGPVPSRWEPAWTWGPAAWIEQRAARLPRQPRSLTLELVTPLDLREQGEPVMVVHFHHLLRSALRSAYAHIRFNCGETLELDHRGLADASRAVEKVKDATDLLGLERESSRQRRRVPITGRVGRLTFQGELSRFIPLLLMAEVYGLGRQRTMGFGGVRLVEVG